MSTVMVPVTDSAAFVLQCEQCNSVITSEKAVAYLLVDQVPCAWCERCFCRATKRNLTRKAAGNQLSQIRQLRLRESPMVPRFEGLQHGHRD